MCYPVARVRRRNCRRQQSRIIRNPTQVISTRGLPTHAQTMPTPTPKPSAQNSRRADSPRPFIAINPTASPASRHHCAGNGNYKPPARVCEGAHGCPHPHRLMGLLLCVRFLVVRTPLGQKNSRISVGYPLVGCFAVCSVGSAPKVRLPNPVMGMCLPLPPAHSPEARSLSPLPHGETTY